MTAFTSVQSGDWNDAATWDVGSGWPDDSGDTAAIAQDHNVTIPSGVSITCGAITYSAGSSGLTTITINGTLDLAGNITMAASSALNMGPGSTLDLNGNNVQAGASCQYNWIGTAVSRITIQSTTTAGRFIADFPNNGLVADLQYVDVSGLGTSALSRSQGTSGSSYQYCTFSECSELKLEEVNNSSNSGILVSHCDFINPSGDVNYPLILHGTVIGTSQRLVEYCTWNGGGQTSTINLAAHGVTMSGCVIKDFDIAFSNDSGATIENCYHENSNGVANGSVISNGGNITVNDSYFWYDEGNHPITGVRLLATYTGNVFDATSGTVGTNWLLYNSVDATDVITVSNNIFLGAGNPVAFLGAGNPFLDFSRNTVYLDNGAQYITGLAIPTCVLCEASGLLSGASTREVYNNLFIDPDTTTAPDAAIDLVNSTADQITYLDYNGGWGYPAGAATPPVFYETNVNVTTGEGPNDIAADPLFVDKDRHIATWDTSLGGAGTKANAVTEMLLLNSGSFDANYTPAALVTWVKAGFVSQQASYQSAGRSGADIGAMAVSPAGGSNAGAIRSSVKSTVRGVVR